MVERGDIIREVKEMHRAGGGKPWRTKKESPAFQKVLNKMRTDGLASSVDRGLWRIEGTDATTDDGQPPGIDQDSDSAGDEGEVMAEEQEPSVGFIYLYYLPAYRVQAEGRGEAVWPCKIGRTGAGADERWRQHAAAFPEEPVVSELKQTFRPQAWEHAIQSMLTIGGRKKEDSPGSEWFITSPDEVSKLVNLIESAVPDIDVEGADEELVEA